MSIKRHCEKCKYYNQIGFELYCVCNKSKNYNNIMKHSDSCDCWEIRNQDKEQFEREEKERYIENYMDEMLTIFGIRAVIDYCKCSIWECHYKAKSEDTNKEDMEEAIDFYIKKIKELQKRLPLKENI